MKCVVYTKKAEDVLRLKLRETNNGVKLIAVNADGVEISNGSILSICKDGVRLYSGVSDTLGIETDSAGFMKITKV